MYRGIDRRRAAPTANGGRCPAHREVFRLPVGAMRSRGIARVAGIVLLAAFLTPAAKAQAVTGAAIAKELQRQIERDRTLREQQETAPDIRLQAPAAADPGRLPVTETPCFPVREIVLKTSQPDIDFAWAWPAADPEDDPASGRCLGSAGINLVMKRVQNAIVARGYVTTRVLAEAQDLRDGILTLSILPGRIRGIRFAEGTSSRANAWNAMPARPGDLLNLRDIEQGLENFKRVPTAEADIQILPGDDPGESDVLVTWKQDFPLRLTLSANDGGSKSTGKYLGSVTVSGDHLLALNDLFYASFNRNLGTHDSETVICGVRHEITIFAKLYPWLDSLATSPKAYPST